MREMIEERTNLYRAVAQTFEWIHGLTSIEFQVQSTRLAEIPQEEETHYSFEVVSNTVRLVGIKHPMALVVEKIHLVMTGVIIEYPGSLQFDQRIAPVELEDTLRMILKADNGGYTTVSVQTCMGLFSGGKEVLTRHFLYRNNFLHLIR